MELCRVTENTNAVGLAARELTSDRKSLTQPWHAYRIIVRLDACTRYGLPSAIGHNALISLYGVLQGLNHDLTAERRGARAQILKLQVTLRVVRVSKPRQGLPPTVERALCMCGRCRH